MALACVPALWCAKPVIAPSYAWKMLPPLGLHETATIDTALYNYYQQAVPSEISEAYATTGNLGTEGMNMIYFERKPMSDFFFMDALRPWIPREESAVAARAGKTACAAYSRAMPGQRYRSARWSTTSTPRAATTFRRQRI